MQVYYILRHPAPHFFSIERLCRVLASAIQDRADVRVYMLPFSSSVWGAPANLMSLPRTRNSIYHVIGDVHYAALALPKAKTVVTYHDAVMLYRLSGVKKHLLLEYSYRRPIQRAAAVTTISRFAKSELERVCGGVERPVRIVHNFVDPVFHWVEPDLRPRLPRILQVGSAPNKNVDVVIQAVAGLDCDLHVVGQPDPRLARLAAQCAVLLHWHTGIGDQELLDLYASATLVTFASAYEGFGLPVIEAQAVGRPVIASRCCSLPEVAGDGAFFVEAGNVSELRAAICLLLADSGLQSSLVERGRRNVARFSLQRIASEYLSIYESLLN